MQTFAQRTVTAERAAVVYALDPVYGAVFAYLLLGERLGAIGLVGAALVTVAAVWSNGTARNTAGADPGQEQLIQTQRAELGTLGGRREGEGAVCDSVAEHFGR